MVQKIAHVISSSALDCFDFNVDMKILATALFFPDYGVAGVPWDLLLLHFYFFAIFIPFIVIFNAAKSSDRENPKRIKENKTRFPDLHPRA